MKKILILTLFLTILTIGAVSAADSEFNNATYDEALSVPEADEAIYESEDDDVLSAAEEVVDSDDDVLSAPDENNEELAACDDENVLGYRYLKTYTNLYDTVVGDGRLIYFSYLYSYDYDYGNLTITIGGEEYYNGKIQSSIYVSDLKRPPSYGVYNVTYQYSNGDHDSFTLSKLVNFTYPFYIFDYVNSINKNVEFEVYLPDDATGNVNIRINNKSYKNVDLSSNRILLLSIDEFFLGYNNISAYYPGDSIHPPKETSLNFYLHPIFSYSEVIFDGEDEYVSVNVPKLMNGTFILGKTDYSSYYYSDVPEYEVINSTEVVDGTATIKMPKFEGVEFFILLFSGDNNFSTVFHAISTNSSSQIKAVATEEVKEGQNVHLKILNEHDEPRYIYLNVEVDGKLVLVEYFLYQNDEVNISIPNLSVGNHTIVVRTFRYSDVHFLKKFNITVKENSNGKSNSKPIDNPADTSLNSTGSSTNDNANGNNPVADKISLSLKTAKVKKSAKKLVLQATLKKNGKAVRSKTVTFKFNGKSYKVKTNSKGIAKLTIKKSVLKKLKVGKKIKYQVGYSKKLVKKTATVKK